MQIINKDQMIEIWKGIEGYEGLYQVSNLGNVKSLGNGNSNNSKERILKPKKTSGYLYVGLSKEGKRKNHLIHRLVAQTFISNPNNYQQVNHRDEDKTNNQVTNLEFCDAKYNCNYGTRNQKLSKPVMCIETGKIYPSTKEIVRQLGFSFSTISSACNGRYKQAYGFHWKYV